MKHRQVGIALSLLFAVSAAAALLLKVVMPDCFIYHFTGWYCPLCGATRAVRALLRGEFLLALRCNLLIFILPCAVSAILLREKATRRFSHAVYNARKDWIALALCAGCYTVVRNLPFGVAALLHP